MSSRRASWVSRSTYLTIHIPSPRRRRLLRNAGGPIRLRSGGRIVLPEVSDDNATIASKMPQSRPVRSPVCEKTVPEHWEILNKSSRPPTGRLGNFCRLPWSFYILEQVAPQASAVVEVQRRLQLAKLWDHRRWRPCRFLLIGYHNDACPLVAGVVVTP